MKQRKILIAGAIILCFMQMATATGKKHENALPTAAISIPQAGNTYITQCDIDGNFAESASGIIDTYTGKITKWDAPPTVISLYVKAGSAGEITLWTTATAGLPGTKSTIEVSLGKQKKKIQITGGAPHLYKVGTYRVATPGYQKFDIKGLKKTGTIFGDLTGFMANGTALEKENHFIPEGNTDDCYWYRRGPSVHMMYEFPDGHDIEYFYNEATVPDGHDINGTYFMLTGFAEGYMGIQSIRGENGENANMVLFSVWSPFDTDDPKLIPNSLHVQSLAHGYGVTVRDFGHEGSGKQSLMQYPWKTGETYRTLVKVTPDGKGNTIYTGFFCDEKGCWHLLSQLKRPSTDTYYTHPHSFLECFIPETSINTRSVVFKNQWARDTNGKWHEIVDGTFTCDNTGLSGVRIDMKGGIVNNGFLLQNCGFFNDTTPYGSRFRRQPQGEAPDIDLDALDLLAAPHN